MSVDGQWWQKAVVYQIYPRSFQDSNGDGIGDLAGVLSRISYLEWLGVDAIWLSPFYPSPMADFGYDVSDYTNVDPIFGTLDDFDRLLAACHKRRIKVILDFVPNHTSDQHPWFQESRSSHDNPKRDWYIWRDPKPDGGPPNNWMSNAGGIAWEFDAHTGQYYYHAFCREQPDLNWRNPAVREAMYDAMRFWLDRGVDGFRVDVLWHLIKDEEFRDDPWNPGYREGDASIRRILPVYSADRPEVHEVVAELRRVVSAYEDRLLIGEIYLPIERLMAYYGTDLSGAHLPFNFQLISASWEATELHRIIDEYERALPPGGWPNWVLGNHDQLRIASRVGAAQARIAAMLLLTLRGTPTLYYGDEIGMTNVPIPPERVCDPFELNMPGIGQGRDPERTPMRWDGRTNAGFSDGEPWLPLGDNWRQQNVELQRYEKRSILQLYRSLLQLRRAHPALSIGSWSILSDANDVLIYRRQHSNESFIIALNLDHRPKHLMLPQGAKRRIILSTHMDRDAEGPVGAMLDLRADEGVVLLEQQ